MFTNNLYLNILIIIGIVLVSAAVLWFAFFFVLWLYLIIVSYIFKIKAEYDKPSEYSYRTFMLAYWVLITNGRLRVHVTGKELLDQIPMDTNFLFVSNHRSKFDHMVHSFVMRKRKILYISKPENFKIYLAGAYMKRNCYLSIVRGNPREGLKTIQKAADVISSGMASIGVFPEGTRSQDGTLNEFKAGCFKIATMSKCPIVVGVIRGTENIHKNFPWKRTNVYFDIIKVFQPEEFADMNTVEIADNIQKMIQEKIDTGLPGEK